MFRAPLRCGRSSSHAWDGKSHRACPQARCLMCMGGRGGPSSALSSRSGSPVGHVPNAESPGLPGGEAYSRFLSFMWKLHGELLGAAANWSLPRVGRPRGCGSSPGRCPSAAHIWSQLLVPVLCSGGLQEESRRPVALTSLFVTCVQDTGGSGCLAWPFLHCSGMNSRPLVLVTVDRLMCVSLHSGS